MARLTTLATRVKTQGDRLATVDPESWRSDKRTSNQRGYTYEWQQARLVFLNENPLCTYCDREGRVTGACIVDHKIPHRGDMVLFWDRTNWQSLCKPCHDVVKKREEAQLPRW
ncbi:HNH endonuclease [Pseudomonas fluorescens NCIMB 11764]|uniref:Putative HNH nuclease YajD n=1 Tax=Pseudomonas fluorescens NCIMB 11764 TaxID=1221522 RepID=A0A0K1QQH4_PSEFL|nr:HNH endonuclease signature motif containing protein [Pseudomonas fluorescens]AKV07907.1 HNH endonuclease [Pseudomonas fluorescens NCIMB 11764]